MRLFLYTLLTSIIILISKIRDKVSSKEKFMHMRFNRTLPWPTLKEEEKDIFYISCCDCGLTHFFLLNHSSTPVRPKEYSYNFRFGNNAYTKPDLDLGYEAYTKASLHGYIEGEPK